MKSKYIHEEDDKYPSDCLKKIDELQDLRTKFGSLKNSYVDNFD